MAVEIFGRAEFEHAVPGAVYQGIEQGEHVYALPTNHPQVRLLIRTSIHASGKSAKTGKDSIRLIIQVKPSKTWKAIGKGPDAYTTRVKGWQGRLNSKIAQTLGRAGRISRRVSPDEIVRFAKTQANNGRPFSLIPNPQGGKHKFNRWLDV